MESMSVNESHCISSHAWLVQNRLLRVAFTLNVLKHERPKERKVFFSFLVMFEGVFNANNLLPPLRAACEIKSPGWQFDAVSPHEFELLCNGVIHLGCQIHYVYESSSACISITFTTQTEICIMCSITSPFSIYFSSHLLCFIWKLCKLAVKWWQSKVKSVISVFIHTKVLCTWCNINRMWKHI